MKAEFSVTEGELRGLKLQAEGLGMTLSNFVRTRLGLDEVKRGRKAGQAALEVGPFPFRGDTPCPVEVIPGPVMDVSRIRYGGRDVEAHELSYVMEE